MAADAKKIPPPKEEGFWSERPGSNRPPRPWQGRALPNELLSHIFCQTLYPAIERTKGRKNRAWALFKKILQQLIYTWGYINYFPVLVILPYHNAWYRAYNSRQKQMQLYMPLAGKKEMPKKTPSCE